jgi:hypothetical protein
MDYDQGILAVPRRLFSQNYVDGGCEGEPPKNTTTDDTLGCYATNYLILVIGVLAACAFVRARERLERAGASGVERALAAAYAAFFALTGLGYGFAGVLHHRFALAPPGWWAAAYIIVLLGNAGLCGVGALLTRGDAPSTKWKLGVAATALVNVAVCVEIKILRRVLLNRRVVLDAIDATPARWRGDAALSPLDRARTAASSPRNDLVKNCRVHPSHWLISTQVAVILLVAATQNMLACGVFTALTLLVMIGVWGKHAMRPCGCGEAAGLDLARACCKGARVCVAGAVKVAAGVVICVEINQCGGCTRQYTKSFLGNDVAVLARSSGEEPASPRHRAGIASMASRTTRRLNAP